VRGALHFGLGKNLGEVNYDAGRSVSTFMMVDLGWTEYPIIDSLGMVQVARYHHVNRSFARLFLLWQRLACNPAIGLSFPSTSERLKFEEFVALERHESGGPHSYHFACEDLVFQMRRFIESHLQLIQIRDYILRHGPNNLQKARVSPDQISGLMQAENFSKPVGICFFGDQETLDADLSLLSLLNKLGNAMRHHTFFSEGYNAIGEELPTILGVEARNDNVGEVTHHNHNAFHLMMGFQDFSERFMRRTRSYFENAHSNL